MDTEAYISSIKKIFLTLFLLTLTDVFVFIPLNEQQRLSVKGPILETVYEYSTAFISGYKKALQNPITLNQAIKSDHLGYIHHKLNLLIDKKLSSPQTQTVETNPSLGKTIIHRTGILPPVSLRQLAGTTCVSFFYQGDKKKKVVLPDKFNKEEVALDHGFLLNFDDVCKGERLSSQNDRGISLYFLNSLLFVQTNGGEWLIGVSHPIYKDLLMKEQFSSNRRLKKDTDIGQEILASFPEEVKKHVESAPFYYLFTLDEISNMILSTAKEASGYYYPTQKIDDALSDISKIERDSLSLEGVSITGNYFIDYLPLIFFALTYLLRIQTSKIRRNELTIKQPWLFSDPENMVDRLVARILAFFPLFSCCVIFCTYATYHATGIRWPIRIVPCEILNKFDSIGCLSGEIPSAHEEPYANLLFVLFFLSLAFSVMSARNILLATNLWPERTEGFLKSKIIMILHAGEQWKDRASRQHRN